VEDDKENNKSSTDSLETDPEDDDENKSAQPKPSRRMSNLES
jgi:hemin uptake protein HemP